MRIAKVRIYVIVIVINNLKKMSDFTCHNSFRRRENPTPGFSKNLHVFVAVLCVVDLEVAVVVGESCLAVGKESEHCVVWSHMSAQDFAATDFVQLHNTDIALAAELSGEFLPCHPVYILTLEYILCRLRFDSGIVVSPLFRTQVFEYTALSLFHRKQDFRLYVCFLPGSTLLLFQVPF